MADNVFPNQIPPNYAVNASKKFLLPDGRNFQETIINVSSKTSEELLKILDEVNKKLSEVKKDA